MDERQLRSLSRSTLVDLTSDVVLLMDKDGTILDSNVRALGRIDPQQFEVGKSFYDAVTTESREKVDALLQDNTPQWRQLNHPVSETDLDHPIRYCALPLGKGEKILSLGQDLLPLAELQQQLVAAQESAEQDYWRLRQAEARFQLLFEKARTPIFVATAEQARLIEANPAAQAIMKHSEIGNRRYLTALFHAGAEAQVEQLITQARASGSSEEQDLLLRDGVTTANVIITLLRQGNKASLIVQLDSSADPHSQQGEVQGSMQLLENLPEPVTILDNRQRVVWANLAFAELCQLASPEHAYERELSDWIGRSAVDVNVLFSNTQKNGTLRAFATVAVGEQHLRTDVDITAVTLDPRNSPMHMGLVIMTRRSEDREPSPAAPEATDVRVKNLIGQMPLKELVRESAEQIERLAIDAALSITDDNRAAAAEMLGISRQSLYFKLRRYGYLDPNE